MKVLLTRVFAVLCCVAAWVALALQYIDTETVMGTGPVVIVVATVTATLAGLTRQWLILALAFMHTSMTIFMFLLVITLSWSPDDAQQPFFWMTRAYVVGWTLALAHVLFSAIQRRRSVTWGETVGRVPEKS